MRKIILFALLALVPLVSAAQIRFGYLSVEQVLRSMPAYAEAQKDLAQLRSQYDAEMQRAQSEFNAKYEEFLERQNDLAPSILRKRQVEIMEFMEKNMAFREEAKRLLEQAEQQAISVVKAKLHAAIRKLSKERGYAFVLNTDNDACPYVDPAMGEDITPFVKSYLE